MPSRPRRCTARYVRQQPLQAYRSYAASLTHRHNSDRRSFLRFDDLWVPVGPSNLAYCISPRFHLLTLVLLSGHRRDLTSRYTLPDNLKVASGPSSNDLSPNVFAPVPTAPSPAGPPKFFIPKPAQQQQTAAGFSENRYPSYSDPSPSPVSVLDAHKSGGGTDTDDSRPSSAFEATAAAGPALSAPAALDGTAAGPSPSEVTTAAAPAVQATEDDASSAPLPAAPEAAEAAPEAAPAASEGASDGLHLYRAPAAGARSSTMDTAGSSISVEEHQANTAKMLSKWLPDRSMGKISPLPWEEDFAYSSSAAASSSYHPMFAWDTASKAGGMRMQPRLACTAELASKAHECDATTLAQCAVCACIMLLVCTASLAVQVSSPSLSLSLLLHPC